MPLEVPGDEGHPDWDALYLARGGEVNPNRPVFTGDVFSLDAPAFIVIQHPCAIRLDGVNLVPQLLVAPIETSPSLSPGQWRGSYKQMPLPNLVSGSSTHYSAYFHRALLQPSAELGRYVRTATLSPVGVNLLLQRWVHHNSRVIVPTGDFHRAVIEQYEEADLIEEWVDESAAHGEASETAVVVAHEWLRSDAGAGVSWQAMLEDAQSRSRVRSAMRAHLRQKYAG